MLNWLPNVKFNDEFRTYTTKDIEANAKNIEESRKDQVSARSALRDLNRKRAIEKATASAIDAKGEISESKLRQSLIDAGFGEEATVTANKIYKENVAGLEQNLELRKKIGQAVAVGNLTEEEANRILGSNSPQTSVDKPSDMQAIAKNPASFWETAKPPEQTQLGPQQAPAQGQAQSSGQTQVLNQTPSQFSPKYAQMGPMDFSQYKDQPQQTDNVKFSLSSDPNLQSKQIAAIKQELSLDIPKGTAKEIVDKIVNERIDQMAGRGNVMPSTVAFDGDVAKKKMKEAEIASAVGKAKNDLLAKVSGQVNTGRSLVTGEVGAATGVKAQALKEDEVMADRTTPWAKGMLTAGLKDRVQKASVQSKGAMREYEKFENIVKYGKGQTDPEFRNTLFNLIKYTIRMKGLEASDQKLSTVESNFKPGVNIDNLLEGFEGDAFNIAKNILTEAYRGSTTNIDAVKNTVKTAQQEVRDGVPTANTNYSKEYFEELPLVGETTEQQERLMSAPKSTSSRQAIEKKIDDKKKGRGTGTLKLGGK